MSFGASGGSVRARALLLLMWTSDTSVYDSINGRVRVHSNGTSADGHSVNYLRVWRLVLNSSYAYGLPGLFKLWRFGKFVDCK